MYTATQEKTIKNLDSHAKYGVFVCPGYAEQIGEVVC
jgi:hypothetical protein